MRGVDESKSRQDLKTGTVVLVFNGMEGSGGSCWLAVPPFSPLALEEGGPISSEELEKIKIYCQDYTAQSVQGACCGSPCCNDTHEGGRKPLEDLKKEFSHLNFKYEGRFVPIGTSFSDKGFWQHIIHITAKTEMPREIGNQEVAA
jgi:hypothetical protein